MYIFPKISAYRRDFNEMKYIFFLIKGEELLEKYNEIWEKVKNSLKKEFDSEPVYSEKCLKAIVKSYNRKIDTNFHNNKIPKEGSQFICLSVILIDSVFRTGKNYYPQLFVEECKYVVKEKRGLSILQTTKKFLPILIEKILMKKFPMKKILMRKIEYIMCLVFVFEAFREILSHS